MAGTPLPPFKLERFFAKHEFNAPYLACCSDCQPLTMSQVLAHANEEDRARWEGLQLGYTETQGLPALRRAVAARYHTRVDADHLAVLAPEEGVYLAMHALLSPGDHIVVTYPGYQSLYAIAESMGCRVSRWQVEGAPGGGPGVAFNVTALKSLVTPGTKMLVVNFPHNPTGTTLSLPDWRDLVATCRAQGAWLFSDEMYRFLELSEGDRLPSAADEYERGVALSGVSKALALPGLRIGWLACQDTELIARVCALKDYTTICASAPSEVLALVAVKAAPAIVAANLATIRSNITAFQALVDEFPDVLEWAHPQASSTAWPRLKTGQDVEAWCEELVSEAGVLLLPASVYDHAPSSADGRFRLGLGRTNLPECLSHLRRWLVSKGHQPRKAGLGLG